MIAEPPLLAGAVHLTNTEPSPEEPNTPKGAPGTVAGSTALEALEAEPEPARLVATTVNV